jgi:hypothetical protein
MKTNNKVEPKQKPKSKANNTSQREQHKEAKIASKPNENKHINN